MKADFASYLKLLSESIFGLDSDVFASLVADLELARAERRTVFLCGNGGSAANALHWANDFLYGASKTGRGGLRVHALPANTSVCTCLANDEGYAEIFAAQLKALAQPGDVLIAMSGSGTSPNILMALEAARSLGVRSWALVGFDGGRALQLADRAVHFRVHDMQVAEDCQMVLGHAITRALCAPAP